MAEKDEKIPKGKAVVLEESKSDKAAYPSDEDRERAARLARRTGSVLIQLYNAKAEPDSD